MCNLDVMEAFEQLGDFMSFYQLLSKQHFGCCLIHEILIPNGNAVFIIQERKILIFTTVLFLDSDHPLLISQLVLPNSGYYLLPII